MKYPNARQLKKAEKTLLSQVPKPLSPFRLKVRKPQSETQFSLIKKAKRIDQQLDWNLRGL
jgi:hypothetical protein